MFASVRDGCHRDLQNHLRCWSRKPSWPGACRAHGSTDATPRAAQVVGIQELDHFLMGLLGVPQMLLHSWARSTLGGFQDQGRVWRDQCLTSSVGAQKPPTTEALSDLGCKIFFCVDAGLKLPSGHVRRVNPPFEGFKLLRLHLLRPCGWFVLTPRQSPDPSKLAKFSPMIVAQAGHHGQLELRMGVVHLDALNLNLHFGRVWQSTQKARCVELALQKELLHLLVLPDHAVHIDGHGILHEGLTPGQRCCSQRQLWLCRTMLRWVQA